MKNTFLIFALFLILSSCQDDSKLETITVNNKYTLDVFSNMSKTKELNDEASLQYQNIFKELYVIVIDESAEQFENVIIDNGLQELYQPDLDGYTSLIVDGFESEEGVGDISEAKDTIINGLEAKVFDLEGKVEEYDVYYKLAFLKSQKSYYQIMTWTLLDKKEDFEEKMDKMIYSFKEIRNKTVAK
ncbi:hypothetical protein ACFO3U_09895 [Flavobacterium ponti]|uniref:Uncharacterized protein n=1 Tax=Flavobacterium ponti TaxID=665133 RepID=A0ABV9P3X8_9FLAO